MSLNRCLLFGLCIVLLVGCAKKVAPDGGPKDTTPALVIGTEPATGSTNVREKTIRFVFDDYVDRSVRSAFSVMPTVRFTTSYAGDVVDVEFLEELTPNTTYVVTLGTEFADIRGNKPLQSVSVVFSTGSDIDTGRITGHVDDSNPASLVIFAYPRAETFDTTFSPAVTLPPYRLPVGTSGQFTLNGLADGTYRIMAVRDANRNGVIDALEDFAMTSADVVVKGGVAEPQSLRVGPAIDLTPPQAVSARALSNSSVLISFAERVRIVPSSGAPFAITDTNGTPVRIHSWYQARTPDDRVFIRLRDSLVQTTYGVSITPGSIADSAGLLITGAERRLTFRGSIIRDTSTLRIVSVSVKDSTLLAPDSAIIIAFSESVDTAASIAQGIMAADTAITSVVWDGTTRLMIGLQRLSRTTWQRLGIQLSGLRTSAGVPMQDTTIVRTLKATERVDPGSIQGVVIDSANFGAPMLLRLYGPRGSVIKTVSVTSGIPFTIDSIPAGDVRFDVVRDSNMNGRYDHGSVRPYKPAEAFYAFRRSVVVRARWTIDDVRLVILR